MGLALGLIHLTGCSAAVVDDEPSPPTLPPILATPTSGRSLAALGYTHEPADRIWLPFGVTVTYTADQPNTLIAVGEGSEATTVELYLRETLPGLGWTITDQAAGGLLFEMPPWQGAYAQGTDTWALTVRND